MEQKQQKDFYFPAQPEDSPENVNGKLNPSKNGWFSDCLFSMDEPILKDLQTNETEVYRFTKIPSWQSPSSVRIEKNDSEVILTKRKSTTGRYFMEVK